MNDKSTSYGAKDKHSLVQWIRIWTAITFLVKKNWTPRLALVGLMAGRQAGWQTKYGWILKSLQSSTG